MVTSRDVLNYATEDAPHKITPLWNENSITLKNYENHLQLSYLGNKTMWHASPVAKETGIAQNLYSCWQGREIILRRGRGKHSVHRVLMKYIENISTIIKFGLCTSSCYDHYVMIYYITFSFAGLEL